MAQASHGHRHDERADLAGEHRLNDILQIVLLIIFLIIWSLDTFFLKITIRPVTVFSAPLKIIVTVFVVLAGWYLASSGLKTVFGTVREKPVVIRTGVFRMVRHPIYLASMLFYFPFILNSFSQAAAVVWIGIWIYYYISAHHEEKLLIAKFGDEYLEYIRDVPMLIPGFRSPKSAERK